MDTYSAERQPVGASIIARANQGFREHAAIWELLGMLEPDLNKRTKIFKALSEHSPDGARRRKEFQDAVKNTEHEFHGIGIEMNQQYVSSAVFLDDEGTRPPLPKDPILDHEITTFPGSRLPHAWLNRRVPQKPISTIDIAGHGTFCLITGVGGDEWRTWASRVAEALGVMIKCYSIGWQQEYEDVYFDWARRREIGESGCVLVRPDRFVAWRCQNVEQGSFDKLLLVMKRILAR